MMSLQQKQHSPRRSNLNPSAREWFPPGYLEKQTDPEDAQPEQHQAANQEVNPDAVFMLSELPLEVRWVQSCQRVYYERIARLSSVKWTFMHLQLTIVGSVRLHLCRFSPVWLVSLGHLRTCSAASLPTISSELQCALAA